MKEDRFKFRVYDRELKQMRYPDDGTDYDRHDLDEVYSDPFGMLCSALNNFDFEKSVLMQCTGLKDKNGVEIYEGDIINIPVTPLHVCVGGWRRDLPLANPDTKAVIEFINGEFRWLTKTNNLNHEMGALWPLGADDDFKTIWNTNAYTNLACEVIGNVYENHELLTQ